MLKGGHWSLGAFLDLFPPSPWWALWVLERESSAQALGRFPDPRWDALGPELSQAWAL